ncbi:MAG: TetR/AcrR family transcriptional regulator, partial [Kofleriaceae bacterium]
GYGKTSLDDIAKKAGISRPLIYRKYKNKEAVFTAVFEEAYAERYPAAEAAVAGPGSKRARLARVYELLLLEPWDQVARAPRAAEFFEACSNLFPEVEAKHERMKVKCTQAILGSKELAELFVLAVDGLELDLPKTAVLRRRVQLLIEQFVP